MYDNTGTYEQSDGISSETHLNSQQGGATSSPEEPKKSESKLLSSNGRQSRVSSQFRAALEERLSRVSTRSPPSSQNAASRRSRLQKQQEISEPGFSTAEPPERGSLTPSMRKKYLKDLLLNNKLHSGFGSILLSRDSSASSRDYGGDAQYGADENNCTFFVLDPMEHAWMLSVIDGNYETILEYLSEDPSLLTKKDFISGYSAIHWLAKYGRDEALIKLLKLAEKEGFPVNVNLKGSGGLTPLHVAAMHSQYMVIKILVGAFSANVDVMDYNGKRAWQYLKGNAPAEMKELLGAWDDDHTVGRQNVNNNSSGSELPLQEEILENVREPEPFERRNARWAFASFKKFFGPFTWFSKKDCYGHTGQNN
ncbi:ankyrin repeat domain-containing protein SOWAHC [Chanos chanos]|uniref:Ankyrin repeat domain-containing protein SOWAHC n=1 Tax=Chanos chanos TaxID=29144 RepID=A0A6J2UQ90_CHACN|nr:ankyrin repeat domain-containing protein SOWAHC-like [Chanos chanos]